MPVNDVNWLGDVGGPPVVVPDSHRVSHIRRFISQVWGSYKTRSPHLAVLVGWVRDSLL
jgi:hypothetical protein